ncbi:MAG: type II secretion system protein GspK [Candidatus Euphemobacter frigidus]|nr:type II secretion system protein GspK [Candidatus Euphemobacter frigidus]MDP8276705.1 type II secretion system protein GspK [Candidatus Euphemobacter frigidus]
MNPARKGARAEAQSGVVLLTVVLVIVLLGVLVMQYNYLSTLDVRMAAGFRDNLEAYYLARAGISQAIALLEEDKLVDLGSGEGEEVVGNQAGGSRSEEEEDGIDSLDEDWARPQSPATLGSGTYYFMIIDEERKFNLNLLLEDAVKEIAAAREGLAGGESAEEEDESEKKKEGDKEKRKQKERAEKEEKKENDREEDDKEDEEIEIDDESTEYLALKLLLEKIRALADAADGIDPFAKALFDTPKGTMDAIVDWFEEDEGSDPDGISRSGPMETIGELALIKDMTRTWLMGAPGREEIEIEKEESELQLIDPWARKPFPGLRGYLTVYGDGKVNINTASREVLEVMLQDDNDDQMTLAGDIIDAREELPFQAIEDINNDEFLSEEMQDKFLEHFKVQSEYFTILSEGRVGETTARVRAVVQRRKNRIVVCYWRFEGR